MRLKIDQSPDAVADILRVAEYLAEKADLDTSERFLAAATRTFRKLADMPQMGVQKNYSNPRLVGMRRFPISEFPRYLVFYQATETELQILRVLHGAQNLDQIFRDPDAG